MFCFVLFFIQADVELKLCYNPKAFRDSHLNAMKAGDPICLSGAHTEKVPHPDFHTSNIPKEVLNT